MSSVIYQTYALLSSNLMGNNGSGFATSSPGVSQNLVIGQGNTYVNTVDAAQPVFSQSSNGYTEQVGNSSGSTLVATHYGTAYGYSIYWNS